MLFAAARLGPGKLRLWAARKAAERGLHRIALRAAAGDPYVISMLGLYHLVEAAGEGDNQASFGKGLARAALTGALPADIDWRSLSPARRRRLASALALSSPERAGQILPEDAHRARAACLIAAGDIGAATAEFRDEPDRESRLLAAHIALSRGRYREGREAWNAAFAADGLAPPLEASDAPVNVDQLSALPGEAVEGPLISVIVPYRDAAATLGHALDSLCSQSWRNLEILAVDDRSSDAGPVIAARAAAHDRRILCLGNQRAPGVYGARNTAIGRATGDYVAFLDADDWSPPERMARQAAALARGAAVSIANHVRIDEGGRPVAPRVFPLARPVPISLMTRRESLLSAGPFEEVETGADSELLGRLQMRFGRGSIARDPAILLLARWRSGSLSEAREGGLLGRARLAYRADWMFRHAGLPTPLASADPPGLETAGTRRPTD